MRPIPRCGGVVMLRVVHDMVSRVTRPILRRRGRRFRFSIAEVSFKRYLFRISIPNLTRLLRRLCLAGSAT